MELTLRAFLARAMATAPPRPSPEAPAGSPPGVVRSTPERYEAPSPEPAAGNEEEYAGGSESSPDK